MVENLQFDYKGNLCQKRFLYVAAPLNAAILLSWVS